MRCDFSWFFLVGPENGLQNAPHDEEKNRNNIEKVWGSSAGRAYFVCRDTRNEQLPTAHKTEIKKPLSSSSSQTAFRYKQAKVVHITIHTESFLKRHNKKSAEYLLDFFLFLFETMCSVSLVGGSHFFFVGMNEADRRVKNAENLY